MRELGVRQSQQLGDVNVQHIDGKRNIADLFTKEIKDAPHFQKNGFHNHNSSSCRGYDPRNH
jgi:hypothetical protein